MKNKKSKIVVTAGGTGGHVIPAITLCKTLIEDKIDVQLLYDERVKHIVNKQANFKTMQIYFAHHFFIFKKFAKLFMILFNTLLLLLFFIINRPKLVIGFGGYVTAPALIAARVLQIPIALIEQNSILGRVNREFLKNAKFIITAFSKTQGLKASNNKLPIYKFGMFAPPEMHNFKQSTHKEKSSTTTILITGGSQGSYEFSHNIPKALTKLPPNLLKKLNIVFQTKQECVEETKAALKNIGVNSYKAANFFYDMPNRIMASDIIIARAGASTIGEICAAGKCAILVPYKHAKDNHQLKNATALENAKAAVIVLEDEVNSKLAPQLITLLGNREARTALSQNAAELYNQDNISNIVEICKKFA